VLSDTVAPLGVPAGSEARALAVVKALFGNYASRRHGWTAESRPAHCRAVFAMARAAVLHIELPALIRFCCPCFESPTEKYDKSKRKQA
jgi:hypothetical protein